MIKEVAGVFRVRKPMVLRDPSGKLLIEEGEIGRMWKEYNAELFGDDRLKEEIGEY